MQVIRQRTRLDIARCVKDVVDVHDRSAERSVLVMDQLNTHAPASLYAAIPATDAQRLKGRLELRSTPNHGSRLNIAEIELVVLQTTTSWPAFRRSSRP